MITSLISLFIEDVGANIFVSNLAPEVDENMLKTVFMAFGQFACEPKVNHNSFFLYVDCT